MKNRLARGSAVALGSFLFVFILSSLGLMQSLEWESWDWRLRLLSSPSQASREIILVLVDQESLDIYEKEQGLSWPWPRQMYSAIIRFCRSGGAKAVFLDLIFSETSNWGVEDDADLAQAIKEAGNVFLPIFVSRSLEETEPVSVEFLKKFSVALPNFPAQAIQPMNSASLPIEYFLQAVKGIGNANFSQDSDGIFRRLPLLFEYKGLTLPSLPLALALFLLDGDDLSSLPLDRSGMMVLRYHGPTGTYRSYSAAAVINSYAQLEEGKNPQIPADEFSGKIVFLGSSAPGLLDLRPTPFSAICPGVEVQATALDNLLRKDFIRVPAAALYLVFLGFFALLTGIGTSLINKAWKAALLLIFALSLVIGGGVLCFLLGYWLEMVAPLFSVVTSFIAASLINYAYEGRRRRFIKSVFSRYLSPHVVDRLIRNPELLKLGGEEREVTLFFSDVAGFTSLSEGLSPEELVNFLNVYLSEMTDIILSQGGTLDKYEGDAIIAFWNAPLDQSDHALRACRAALQCQKRLEELGPEFLSRFGHKIAMRIGINSGPAVVGNMGSHSRFDYTAMGDTVNLASRLEGACKVYELPILIGEATSLGVQDFLVLREVDLIQVKGKKIPVRVFEIVGEKGIVPEEKLEKVAVFNQGLSAYRSRRWDEALKIFQSLEEDDLSRIYVDRILNFRASPPAEDWSGIFELESK